MTQSKEFQDFDKFSLQDCFRAALEQEGTGMVSDKFSLQDCFRAALEQEGTGIGI